MESLSNPTLDIVDFTIYKKNIGSLIYLTNTRKDIYFTVNTLIQYIVEPRRVHMVMENHILTSILMPSVYPNISNLISTTHFSWLRKTSFGFCHTSNLENHVKVIKVSDLP